MFFRRKKKKDPVLGSAPLPAGEVADSEEGEGQLPSTQFLTGETSADGRTVQVLLEAIARVSGSQDLESLLTDIVDRSI